MSEKPKRPWLRFHLVTAIFMVATAGCLLGANLRARYRLVPGDSDFGISDILWQHAYGWPIEALLVLEQTGIGGEFRENGDVIALTGSKIPEPETGSSIWTVWFGYRIALDVLVAVAILLAVAFISEWLIRRREARP